MGLGWEGKGVTQTACADEPGIQNAFSVHEIQSPEGPSYLWTFSTFWQALRSGHAKQFSFYGARRFSFIIFPEKPYSRNCGTDCLREEGRERKSGNPVPG